MNNIAANQAMHPTAKRLFDALYSVTKAQIDGSEHPGDAAKALEQSPATITNWKTRGVSKEGLLKAHALFGISPTWVETGQGTPLDAPPSLPGFDQTPTLRQLVESLADWLNTLTNAQREQAAQRLQTLALAPDSQKARDALMEVQARDDACTDVVAKGKDPNAIWPRADEP